MPWEQIIVQLGIGGSIGAGTLWILREYLMRTDQRIDERDRVFIKFVMENNHKVTELVVTSTEAIKESTRAIKESTNAVKASSELICKATKAFGDSVNGHK